MKKVDLSIIILSWNTKDILKQCLESIQDRGHEIIVIDNGSKDGSAEYLKKWGKGREEVRVIFNKKNLGFAKANNQGIKIAKGKYILLLNSDTIVQKNTLAKLVRYLENNPSVAAVSPMLFNPNGTKQIDYYMKFPNIFQVLFYHNALIRPLLMRTPLKKLVFSNALNEVDQLPGAALMTRRSIIEKVGGLDEDYHFLFEDVDWCYRVKKQNLGKLMIVPDTKVIHLGGASWKQWLKKDRFGFYHHYFKSLLLFVRKHYPNKRICFRTAIRITLLINGAAHFLVFNWKKGIAQLKLLIRL